ncbi:MAG: DUF2442 domain-containing protein [Rhodospirillaceae bacterium]|nr:DUF2442 domain-containing protein [Rhodospirillaceae bacterium]
MTQANRLKAMYPRAMDARYDRRLDRILIRLSSGIDIGFSPQDCQGLEGARPVDLQSIEISPSGFGLHFPRLDADIYLPALLEGAFGSKRWAAARLGALGGSARSGSKARAARANGKLGGRPRKAA